MMIVVLHKGEVLLPFGFFIRSRTVQEPRKKAGEQKKKEQYSIYRFSVKYRFLIQE